MSAASTVLAAASSIPSPVQGAAVATSGVLTAIEGIFGVSSGRYNNPEYQAAERAIAAAAYYGVALGSVTAGRQLLYHVQHNTANYNQGEDNAVLATARANYPATMAAADAAGPLTGQPDGYELLRYLADNNVPFNVPYMGYSTANVSKAGLPPSPSGATAAVVQRLQVLKPVADPNTDVHALVQAAASAAANKLAATGPAAPTGAPGSPAPAGAVYAQAGVPWWLAVGVVVAIVFTMNR